MQGVVVPFQSQDRAPTMLAGAVSPVRRFAAGAEIYGQEDEADCVYRVVSGVVRTSRLTRNGRRQIGDFYYPGEFFGLEMGEERRYSAEALSACEVEVIRRSALESEDSPESLRRAVWAGSMRQLERAQEHVMLVGGRTACERVAGFLLDVVQRSTGDLAELPMGRQDIADYLGLTIETVSRMISHLQADGVVEFVGLRRFRMADRRVLAGLAAA